MSKTSVYYLKPGYTHSYVQEGELSVLQPGESIELSDAQAEAFGDRFSKTKPAITEAAADGEEDEDANKKPAPAPAPAPATGGKK